MVSASDGSIVASTGWMSELFWVIVCIVLLL
jgi:hypothetical protein